VVKIQIPYLNDQQYAEVIKSFTSQIGNVQNPGLVTLMLDNLNKLHNHITAQKDMLEAMDKLQKV
jgi:hypothetical protein